MFQGDGEGERSGLATVYGIIKQHGGQIYVYSEPGKGTTFKMYLPATPHARADELEPVSDTVPAGSETILLAEDDAGIRKMIQMFLAPMGSRSSSPATAGRPSRSVTPIKRI